MRTFKGPRSGPVALAAFGQAWMTGTDRDLFAPIAEEAQIFAVNRGRITLDSPAG